MKSKKGSQVHHGEVEKWKAVYRILFPDDHDADMPSPCKSQLSAPYMHKCSHTKTSNINVIQRA